jgi:hypothetical protein
MITNKCLINKDKTIVDKLKININQIYFRVNCASIFLLLPYFIYIYFYFVNNIHLLHEESKLKSLQ